MSPSLLRITFALAIFGLASYSYSQDTLTNATSNNTSACSAVGGHCHAVFAGMSDSASGVFNAPPGNVSHSDLQSLEYSNANTALFVHFMPWFCMQPGSTATGPGTSCNSHLQVGYNSNDPATVAAQMNDIQARGFQGAIIDWYGPTALIEEQTTELVMSDLADRCAGNACPLSFAINEDQGSITRSCPLNGGGTDQTNCILQKLESDMDYANLHYFPSPAYLTIDGSTTTLSSSGRPVVFFFICETCFTSPSPNWSYVWNQLRSHVQSYTTGSPLLWFIFRNSGGFSHTQSDGAYAWINHYGSNDPYGLLYLDNFYDTSLKWPTLQPWGASWKGFDNTLAAWHPTVSLTGQQCGNTWLQTFSEMTHNNDYGPAHQLPLLQVATWNDYEEGTEIETGIDNCLALTANVTDGNLTWSPTFSAASGNENTVDHYAIFNSLDGQSLTLLATVPSGIHAVPLVSMNLATDAQTFFVEAIGKGGIQSRISNAVSYTPLAVAIFSVAPQSGSTAGGTNVTITGSSFAAGATVSFGGVAAGVTAVSSTSISVVTPVHSAGTVDVVVNNPDGTGATSSSAFTYTVPPPTITAVAPTSGTIAGGTAGTITGTNFQKGATVTFGGVPATVSALSASSISVVTPAHAAGTVDVVVSNLDGSTATAGSAFTYVVSPSFTLTASPTSKSLTRGTNTSFSITVAPQNGFTGVVAFGVSGLPAGTSATFSPLSVTTSGKAKMTVATTRSASSGTYKLTISGENAALSISTSASVSLTLK